MSQALIERARKLKKEMEGSIRQYRAEGLAEDGGPLDIYVHPITTSELQELFKVDDVMEKHALTIDLRARDKEGKRLFTGEKTDILHSFPTKMIRQLANKINEDINDPSFYSGSDLVVTVDDFEAAKK